MDQALFNEIASAQQALKPLSRRTEKEKEQAQKIDRATHKELMRLARLPENTTCADCDAKFPGWAALPHGVFLCINCAQIHRHLGRHISQVKAINTGTYLWYPDEVKLMQTMGNRNAETMFMGGASKGMVCKPSAKRSHAEALAFARDKYENKKWAIQHISTKTTALMGTSSHNVGRAQARDCRSSASPSQSRTSDATRPLISFEEDAAWVHPNPASKHGTSGTLKEDTTMQPHSRQMGHNSLPSTSSTTAEILALYAQQTPAVAPAVAELRSRATCSRQSQILGSSTQTPVGLVAATGNDFFAEFGL